MSRLLVVTNDFPPRQGGIETFVASLCGQMDPRRLVVHTARMQGDVIADRALPFPVVRDPARLLVPTYGVARRVSRTFSDFGCDRVLFGASMPLGLLAPRLRKLGARRMVALTHGHEVWWARTPLARGLLSRTAESVDVMTYVSEWCRDRVAPALSSSGQAKLRPLSPGLDPELFRPGLDGAVIRERLGIGMDHQVVLCVARMVPRKGQDTLVEAWPEVLAHHPTAALVLVGGGPYLRSVRRMAERLGVADSVRFVGAVPHGATPGYFAAADVFAMPCRTRRFGLEPEAFGIVFLEAQACGLPVLIGDSGGAPETLTDGRCGEVVRPRARPVARALRRILSDDSVRARARDNAPRVGREHAWSRTARALDCFLGEE